MNLMIVTLNLPENLHELVEKVATASKLSEEEVLLEWLKRPLLYPSKADYETILEDIPSLSNIQLWTLVYREIPVEDEERYQEIYEKHESGEILTQSEEKHWRFVADLGLIVGTSRLKALLTLKERGEDVAHLIP
jgi:hypothetical protein